MEKYNLDNAQNLMLFQGISLIDDGLRFLEWCGSMPNDEVQDLFDILRSRFEIFKDYALDNDKSRHLFFSRAKKSIEDTSNVTLGWKTELLKKIQKTEDELRAEAWKEERRVKQMQQQ